MQGTKVPRMGDHPRSRGVYLTRGSYSPTHPGSSPLARGLPHAGFLLTYSPGIIPARAGFTRHTMLRHAHYSDHPRSRGVYELPARCYRAVYGSSPLARGLQGRGLGGGGVRGIIPARAGFTITTLCAIPIPWDHPRSRGVYTKIIHYALNRIGSSPLARGLHSPLTRGSYSPGIIPARAGFTNRNDGVLPLIWDHPRSRGVYMTTPRSP